MRTGCGLWWEQERVAACRSSSAVACLRGPPRRAVPPRPQALPCAHAAAPAPTSAENGEAIQILKYVDGQKYEPHTDYFHDK